MERKKPSPEYKTPKEITDAAQQTNRSVVSTAAPHQDKKSVAQNAEKTTEKEIGGFADSGLPEPTRFGDWEVKGRCSDF